MMWQTSNLYSNSCHTLPNIPQLIPTNTFVILYHSHAKSRGIGVRTHDILCNPITKKSHEIKSGDRGGHGRKGASSRIVRPIQRPASSALRWSRTTQWKCDGAPSYCKMKSSLSSCNCGSNHSVSMSWYTVLVIVFPQRKINRTKHTKLRGITDVFNHHM